MDPCTPAPDVTIRPIVAADAPALEDFYRRLGDDSRRLRFFAVTSGLTHAQSAAFCSPDHCHEEGFVATITGGAGGGSARVVGHVCLEPAGDGRAEVAIAVADDLQRRGIGQQLMEAALEWAREAGVGTLIATTLASNAGIHRLIASLGIPATVRGGGDTSTVELAVPSPAIAA